jgi:hypothetical protein
VVAEVDDLAGVDIAHRHRPVHVEPEVDAVEDRGVRRDDRRPVAPPERPAQWVRH